MVRNKSGVELDQVNPSPIRSLVSSMPQKVMNRDASHGRNGGISQPTNSLGVPSNTPTELQKYPKFPKFPLELRLKVIKNAISTEATRSSKRVVEILYFDPCNKDVGTDGWPYHQSDHKHNTYSQLPGLHQVDTEFRAEAFKKWSVSIDRPSGDSYTRFDPEETIVYLSYTELSMRAQDDDMDMYTDMLTADVCKKIKHLAIDAEMWSTPEKNPLQKFTNLETFTFVVHDAGCMPDWDPEKEKEDFTLVSVSKDDLEVIRSTLDLGYEIENLAELCEDHKAILEAWTPDVVYRVPVIKTAILYCDDIPCCNSVESVRDHLMDVCSPSGPCRRP
ncbi:hypothetical protein VTL71DRAFT_11502 [Oculimacula yallundae]|uniref:2EXR domain-containing protein n=1 Tax=Oculimacula yallundae TaxID=86028 RepID=A0ABR4CQE2_9HELO